MPTQATSIAGTRVCRYCNMPGLHWRNLEYRNPRGEPTSGWRLMHPNGTLHSCAEGRQAFFERERQNEHERMMDRVEREIARGDAYVRTRMFVPVHVDNIVFKLDGKTKLEREAEEALRLRARERHARRSNKRWSKDGQVDGDSENAIDAYPDWPEPDRSWGDL